MVPGDVSKGPWGIPAKKIFKLHGDLIIAQSNPQIRQFCCYFIPFSSIFPPMFPDFAHWFSWFAAPGSSLDIFINFSVLIIWGGAEVHGFMNKHQYRDEFIHWMDTKYKSAISWIFISFLQCWSYKQKLQRKRKPQTMQSSMLSARLKEKSYLHNNPALPTVGDASINHGS